MSISERLAADWYAPRLTALTRLLVPISLLFALGAAARRLLYRLDILRVRRASVPVIIVGNITAGGSGKTPLVAALCRALAQNGFRPGIVSRGYGRVHAESLPLEVTGVTDPQRAGDEPLLLARSGFPVVVATDRVAAASALVGAHPDCDVIVGDDGLQHYALARDVEIVVIDKARGLGNGWPLPAGPLRESVARLDAADAVVELVETDDRSPPFRPGASRMTLSGDVFRGVVDAAQTAHARDLAGSDVHAVAGIGNPDRFFRQLSALGLDAARHVFPDHHRYSASDLSLPGARVILMTEKDAVKCTAIADARCWFLPVNADLDPALIARIVEMLRGFKAP